MASQFRTFVSFDRGQAFGFSGSFDAASEDVLMRHQKVLRCGIERCALRPPALRVRARAVRYRQGIASDERGQSLDDLPLFTYTSNLCQKSAMLILL